MDALNRFFQKNGWWGIVSLVFYPIMSIMITPFYLLKSLWNCKVLLNGKWQYYAHFDAHLAILSLFYWTEALNIDRYGIKGRSPTLGLGNFSLAKWFHITFLSLYAYWRFGAVTLLVGMFGWLFMHGIWLFQIPFAWCSLIIFMLLISTSFYLNLFNRQNYNVMGWMFFPLALYAISVENWNLAAISWLLISFGSFTVAFISGLISVFLGILLCSWEPVVALIPLLCKTLLHFWANIQDENLLKGIMEIAKGIGLTNNKGDIRYKRIKKIGMANFYYVALHLQFILVYFFVTETYPILVIFSAIIYIINLKARFLDDQSLFMLLLSTAAEATFVNPYSWIVLGSFWIAISPFPALAGFTQFKVPYSVPEKRPISLEKLILEMENFIKCVSSGEKVLFVFSEPPYYNNMFDGLYPFVELPLYVASKKEIHLFPDWWAVFETNYQGSIGFWGRDPEAVKVNSELWKADFVIVYEKEQSFLKESWENSGFKVISKLEWGIFKKELDYFPKDKDGDPVDFWLLKVGINTAHQE